MPWFRLDDDFGNHPKALKAGLDGVGLFVTCGTHCARYLTDGFVDEATALSRAPQKLIDKVTAANLWTAVPGGYLIEDYLEYNPSREQVLAERRAAAERQKRARERASARRSLSNRHGVTNGVTGAVTAPGVTVPPYPYPIDAAAAASDEGSGGGIDLPVDVQILRSKMAAVTALSALRWDVRPAQLAEITELIGRHGDQRLVDVAIRTCRTPPPVSVSAFIGTWRSMPEPGRTVQAVEEARCPECSLTITACDARALTDPEFCPRKESA